MKPGKLLERITRIVTGPLGNVLTDELQDQTKAVIVAGAEQGQILFPEVMDFASGDEVELVSDHEFQVKGITLFSFRWIMKLRLKQKGE